MIETRARCAAATDIGSGYDDDRRATLAELDAMVDHETVVAVLPAATLVRKGRVERVGVEGAPSNWSRYLSRSWSIVELVRGLRRSATSPSIRRRAASAFATASRPALIVSRR